LIRDVQGTCWKTHGMSRPPGSLELPPFDAVRGNKKAFAEAFGIFYRDQNFANGMVLMQDNGSWIVAQNPPSPPLSSEEMDEVYVCQDAAPVLRGK
jgi:hypothetical protein